MIDREIIIGGKYGKKSLSVPLWRKRRWHAEDSGTDDA